MMDAGKRIVQNPPQRAHAALFLFSAKLRLTNGGAFIIFHHFVSTTGMTRAVVWMIDEVVTYLPEE